MTDKTTAPPEEPTAPEETEVGSPVAGTTETVRYCVYDNTLQRFISGVVDTYDDAQALADLAPEAHDVEVREV